MPPASPCVDVGVLDMYLEDIGDRDLVDMPSSGVIDVSSSLQADFPIIQEK